MIKFGEKYKNDDILPYILKICDGTNNILKIIFLSVSKLYHKNPKIAKYQYLHNNNILSLYY